MPILKPQKLKKIKSTILFLVFILFVLTSCSNVKDETPQDNTAFTDVSSNSTEAIDTTENLDATGGTSSSEPEDLSSNEVQDPHSYLILSAGNAEELTFEYVTTNSETQTSFWGQFFRFDGISGEKFETVDHEGELISITELELPDGVYYIDESKQTVYRYTDTADDLMLYRLMAITANDPVEIKDSAEGKCYLYELPFDQDDTMVYRYEILMTANGIKSLDTFLDDRPINHISFTDFLSVASDPGLLQIPESYTLEEFDYGVQYMNIPPWW